MHDVLNKKSFLVLNRGLNDAISSQVVFVPDAIWFTRPQKEHIWLL